MYPILFAWIGVLFFGFETVISKLILKHSITNPWLFNFIATFFFALFIIPIALANHAGIPVDWTFLLLAVLLNSAIFILNVLCIFLLDVSVLNPFGNLRTAFTVLFGSLFLGEVLHIYQYGLILLMFIAGIFASSDEELSIRAFFRWPILLAIFNMACSALIGFAIKRSAIANGFWTTNLWLFGLTLIVLLLTYPLFKKDIKTITKKKLYPVAIVSLIGLLGTLSVNKSFTWNISITNSITAIPSAMIIAVLFSIFAPKLLEKHTLKTYLIRFAAASIMIIAALQLS